MSRLTPQQVRDRAELESHLREHGNEVAEMLGWTWVWVGPLRTAHGWVTPTRGPLGKGWPDTLYIHRRTGRYQPVEFKKELGKVSPDQAEVHRIFRAAGLEVLVIRPSSFDQLVEALRG